MSKKTGKLIIFSGVSGVGKNSILKKLFLNDSLNLVYSISMTTRKKRSNEVNKVDYFFVSREDFKKAIANNELLEWAIFCDNYYGTPINFVNEQLKNGKNVVLEIDVQGALNVMKMVPDALSIFILPPSIEELKNRLHARATDDEETINKRLNAAIEELKYKDSYKYNVINDKLEEAVNKVAEIIKSEK